jgi:hypothetical protein
MSGSDPNLSMATQSVSCEKCGTQVQLLVQAQTRFVGCSHCGAYYELSPAGSRFIKTFSTEYDGKTDPIWALSTRITLRETKYAVVGFLNKKEEGENVYWREYILFNPVYGYGFLAEYNGHWVLLKAATEHPNIGKKLNYTFSLGYQDYRLYHRYTGQVVSAQGEFSYDVTSATKYTEYVCPPYLMTREVRQKEVRWYKGEYLSPDEVEKAGPEKIDLPRPIGVGACQPNHLRKRHYESLGFSMLAIFLLILLQGFLATSTKETKVFNDSYDLQDSLLDNTSEPAKGKPIITPSFPMAEGTKNAEIVLYSPLDNSWFEAEITLVNEQTGAEQDLNMGVEYYHGYEGGESWSEGSYKSAEVLSAVPEGSYHLVIVPIKPAGTTHFEVWVNRDVLTWSNFWIALALICLLPLYQYYRYYDFEQQRWMNSDFSPYDK